MSTPWRRLARRIGRPLGWAVGRDEGDRVIDFVTEPMYEGFAHLNRSVRDLEAEVERLRQEVRALREQKMPPAGE
ncbi:MAG TPA: hypothetical protein VF137_08320 [Candidatus Dormibacteraeota bacterium]